MNRSLTTTTREADAPETGLTTASAYVCNVCEPASTASSTVETAVVRPNIRRLQQERFSVWRCPRCASIHAKDEVDLEFYYRDYPFLKVSLDWRLRAMYRNLLGRLKKAGLARSDQILDYGCGSGNFVKYLHERGFLNARGYDAFSAEFSDTSVLSHGYDCITSQDVIEHVPAPLELLRTFDGLAAPGALIAIGTPDAAAIDLARPDDYIHTLHQPFHRHILSTAALLQAGRALGWTVSRYYPTMYNNTLVPFINSRFIFHYMACFDNMIDVVFDPIDVSLDNRKLWSPLTLYYALFGYFHAPRTDVMAVFRKG